MTLHRNLTGNELHDPKDHTHEQSEITDFTHTHEVSEITDFTTEFLAALAAARPIFVARGSWNRGGGAAPDEQYINWTSEIRKDSGYTHSTSVDPDEITIDAGQLPGWFKITVDIGILVDVSDSNHTITAQVEHWDGGSWDEEQWADLQIAVTPAANNLKFSGVINFVRYFDTGENKLRVQIGKTGGGAYDSTGPNSQNRIFIERLPTP